MQQLQHTVLQKEERRKHSETRKHTGKLDMQFQFQDGKIKFKKKKHLKTDEI